MPPRSPRPTRSAPDADQLILNPEQERAAQAMDGPVLVLAGAGSGKTRVITARLARLLQRGQAPSSVVALTFTNKAAAEMRERAGADSNAGAQAPIIATFHAFGLQLVRGHMRELGFRATARERLTVYDQSDSAQLLRQVADELRIDADLRGEDPKLLQRMVSAYRMGRRVRAATGPASAAGDGAVAADPTGGQLQAVTARYLKRLRLHNAADFDDLILLPLELLRGAAGDNLRSRYQHVLVDEFQDTSERQYEVLHELTRTNRNVCVVGDDDQSIYSWRGASADNIERFAADFPELLEVKLEQNYRSTTSILDAANAVIANNSGRRPKRLWTRAGAGHRLVVSYPETETDEAEALATQIRTLAIRDSITYSDCGVLVRTNSLTRALEEVFVRDNLPYVVSGGMSFFERREVRDLIAYLRVLVNPADDVSLLRIINTPRRGLGPAAVERIAAEATALADDAGAASLYEGLARLTGAAESRAADAAATAGANAHADSEADDDADAAADAFELTGDERAGAREERRQLALLQRRAAAFMELLAEFRQRMEHGPELAPVLADLIDEIGYRNHLLETERQDVAKWKFLNVDALIGSLADFEQRARRRAPDKQPALSDYLARTALVSRDDDAPGREGDRRGRINLMTIHAAKGLEFEAVFLAGAEDGIVPHARALADDETNLAEERRLFYVALTRARRRLFISAPASRRVRGKEVPATPSRFLEEIPADLIELADGEQELSPEQATELFAELKQRLSTAD